MSESLTTMSINSESFHVTFDWVFSGKKRFVRMFGRILLIRTQNFNMAFFASNKERELSNGVTQERRIGSIRNKNRKKKEQVNKKKTNSLCT